MSFGEHISVGIHSGLERPCVNCSAQVNTAIVSIPTNRLMVFEEHHVTRAEFQKICLARVFLMAQSSGLILCFEEPWDSLESAF